MANNPEKGMEFLSVKEVSQILRIPLRTAYRLANQGRIKSIRIGGKLRCRKEDVEEYYTFGTDFSGLTSRRQEKFPLTRASHVLSPLGRGMGEGERRARPRINSNFTCRYSVNLAPYKNISGTGIIKNISAGGVFLDAVCKDINMDDPVEIKFNLGDIKGRIIRKCENGVAVKFRDLDREVENKIISYIG